MYLEYYSLREQPFAPTPDPRYAFLTPRWRDLLAHLQHLLCGRSGGDLVELTGEAGTGKTLLWRLLLAQLPEHVRVACVLQPRLSPEELIETVCEQLNVDIAGRRDSPKAMMDALSAYLLDAYAQGQRVLLLVDEAQDLPFPTLEQIRLLTNLETPSQRLLQVVLVGQPALRRLLAQPEAGQLGQRVTARYQLQPLDVQETEGYVRHRMAVAGATRVPFTRLGLRALHHHGRGVPRSINLIADRALAAAAASGATEIGERLVGRAAQESLPGHLRYMLRRYGIWMALVLLPLLALWLFSLHGPDITPVQPRETRTADVGVERTLAALREQWPDAHSSQLLAWSELLARWQVGSGDVSVEGAARCDAVIFPGFDCVGGNASLEQLQRFDRPLILQLDRGDGVRYAVLLGVGRTEVRLRLGSRDFQLPRAALDRIWRGRFLAPFRVPPEVPQVLRRGDAGAGIAWVQAQLARLDSTAPPPRGPAYFDAALEARVRKLQTAYGIRADGVVGPETLFALAALGEDGPHLARDVP